MTSSTAGPTPVLRVHVLGSITADVAGRAVELRGAHQRRLLAMLVAADRRVISTDRLVAQLWDDAPPDAASRTFRTYVARLRRSIEAAGAAAGTDYLITDPPGYRLGGPVATDADDFERAVERGRDHLAVGEATLAWQVLDVALALWSGNAFGEFTDEEWAVATAIRLEELRLVARELRVRARIDAGHHSEAIAEIEALVAEHPLREAPRHDLMLALYRAGRHAEALRAGREYAAFLADETGLEPTAQITDLESMILERDPRLDAAPHGRQRRGYRLEEPIATDPLGIIYRARQPSIDREVAIMEMPAEFADDPAFVRGFESRAQAVASVEHAGIVPVYDYWREPGGACLVMRHYPAGTLASRLSTGTTSADRALAVARQVTAALWAAHQRGVAHGNVATTSIWLDDQGNAVLGGFSMIAEHVSNQGDLVDLADVIESMVAVSSNEASSTSHRSLTNLMERLRQHGESSIATAYDVLLELDTDRSGTVEEGRPSAPSTAATGPNPFRGLAAFSETDAGLFFGRESIVDELADVVRRRRVAALIGPSGSGKSSVMRAGLLPRFRAAGAYVTTMVPGTHPLDELEVALTRIAAAPLQGLATDLSSGDRSLAGAVRSMVPDPDRTIVLAIDQFEELFTISRTDERDRFLDVLVEAETDTTTQLIVVATCRADFLERVLDHPAAGQLVRDRSVLITPLSSDELHDAIIGPAECVGMAVEPALVAAIVGDASGSPGSLPMVQYVLTETFEAAADRGVMTLEDYRRLGGVSGAVAQRAEEVFGGLSDDDREAARRLFSRLVAPGEASGPARRRARRTELTTVPEPVIDAFGRARLLSFDRDPATREPTVEVTHEALIRHWPRLVAWVDDERDGLRLLGHITSSAQEWDRADRDDSLLYRGARLVAAEQWAETHPGELSEAESDFLSAGVSLRDTDEQREQRSLRRLRVLTAGLGVFLLVALAAAAIAVASGRRADERAAEAEATRRDAEVAALAGNARVLAATDPITAMLLAVEAGDRSSDAEPTVTTALLESLSADPRERNVYPPVPSLGLSLPPESGPFYSYILGEGDGARVDVVDVDGGTTRSLSLDTVPAAATTDPTGTYLFVVLDAKILLYETATGALLWDQPATDLWQSLAARDGEDLAVAYPDGRLLIHSFRNFAVLASLEGLPGTTALARSGDDRVLAALDDAGNLLVVPVDQPEARVVIPLPTRVTDLALDTPGERLALSSQLGPTFVADLTDPEADPVLIDAGATSDLAFNPDGSLLAVGTGDAIEIYDTATGKSATAPIAFANGVIFHFTGDRTLRAFAPNQGVVEIDLDAPSRIVDAFDIEGWGGVGFLSPDLSTVIALAPDETGVFSEFLVTAATEPSAMAWIPIGPSTPTTYSRPLRGGGYVTADTEQLQYEVRDAEGTLVDTIDLTGNVTKGYSHVLAPRIGTTSDILFLAEGAETLLGSEVVVIDRSLGDVVSTIRDRDVRSVEFADAGENVIVLGYTDGRVRWIDLDGRDVGGTVQVADTVGALAVTDDGSLTAVGGWSGTVTLLDADHQVIRELVNDAPFPIRMAFTGDGERLVVQSEDGSIVLWDVPSGVRIGTLYRTDGLRGAFELTADRSSIVVATATGVVRISVDPAAWKQIACAAADRRLSEAEIRSVVAGIEPITDPCRELAAPCHWRQRP